MFSDFWSISMYVKRSRHPFASRFKFLESHRYVVNYTLLYAATCCFFRFSHWFRLVLTVWLDWAINTTLLRLGNHCILAWITYSGGQNTAADITRSPLKKVTKKKKKIRFCCYKHSRGCHNFLSQMSAFCHPKHSWRWFQDPLKSSQWRAHMLKYCEKYESDQNEWRWCCCSAESPGYCHSNRIQPHPHSGDEADETFWGLKQRKPWTWWLSMRL